MIMYIFDHDKEEWLFCAQYPSDAIPFARLEAGYLAFDGYDALLVNVNTSQFEYFWGI